MKILLFIAVTGSLMLGAIGFAEVERDALIGASGGDASRFSEALLSSGYQPRPCNSAAEPHDRELTALMSAIATVEAYARPWPERMIKDQLALSLVALRLPVPDWSLGSGEIRLSTAEKATRAFGSNDVKPEEHRGNLVRLLVNSCSNFAIGKQVLRYIAATRGVDLARLNQASISAIAADYNGQKTVGSLPEQASKLFYKDAVYHLFYSFLFSPNVLALEQ
ncbi:hypothetical protein [Hyphomicrobium sp.]|jgi:hypothetical protein|uniref:hypothetical protein n=1 Tax=Hyphomicrobium sp. TaxID=82 RepID=UPI003569C1FA